MKQKLKTTGLGILWLLIVSVAIAQTPATFPASLTVSLDGTGNYTTIQEAVNAVRDLSQVEVKIFIKKGVYHEKLVVSSWKTRISLVGESRDSTIISGNDYSGKDYPTGKDPYGKDKYSTYTSYTVLVQGDDFSAENLTVENTAGRVGQAVALHVEGDRANIRNCKLTGNQDTLYTATSSSRQYYRDCYIEGTTDFIFGEATCVFQNCTIQSLTNSYITAAATSRHQKFGFVFFNCNLVSDSASRVFLGRPWRPYAKTVFINCNLGKHIVPEGWDPWKGDAMFPAKEKTTYYAEYNSSGPGADTSRRASWSRQLSQKEVKVINLQNIFAGESDWTPAK